MGKGGEKQLWLCNCTHTVNNCGCGFLLFLSFVRVTWEKVVKNNCGCVNALKQSTIVAVSHSQQMWLWVSFFSFFSQDHVEKGREKQLWLSQTVNDCGSGLLFFLSFVRVTW